VLPCIRRSGVASTTILRRLAVMCAEQLTGLAGSIDPGLVRIVSYRALCDAPDAMLKPLRLRRNSVRPDQQSRPGRAVESARCGPALCLNCRSPTLPGWNASSMCARAANGKYWNAVPCLTFQGTHKRVSLHPCGSSKLSIADASSSNICRTESILVTLSTRRTGVSGLSSLRAPAFFTAWQ